RHTRISRDWSSDVCSSERSYLHRFSHEVAIALPAIGILTQGTDGAAAVGRQAGEGCKEHDLAPDGGFDVFCLLRRDPGRTTALRAEERRVAKVCTTSAVCS